MASDLIRQVLRAVVVACVLGAALIASPRPAQAHAAFVSSEPEPGATLSSAPGVVVMRFTEPLISRLSGATVEDPDGRTFEGEVSGEREIRVPLTTNVPGVYEVRWITVSPVDGHALRGSFRFGVGVSPGEEEAAVGTGPGRGDLLVAAMRAVEYAALLAAVGMLLLGRLARRTPPLAWVRPRVRVAVGVALASGLSVVLGESLLAVGSPSVEAVVAYLTAGSGVPRLARVGAEAIALLLVLGGRGTALPVGVAVVALAASGHAAAVPPRWLGVGTNTLHLLAAGLWAGGIMALATLRPPNGWRGPSARTLLDRFSPVAVPAFLATVGFGILRGAQELSELGDLFTTSYGRVLALKILGVLAMIPLSTGMWLRLRGSPRGEAVLAGAVVTVAALLAAYPLPPARLAEAVAAEERPAEDTSLPRPGDLTMGGDAGEVLVGLTIRPAEPGPNEVLVHVLPLEGEEAAAGIPVRLGVAGRVVTTEDCGTTCRRAELDLEGDERMEVEIGGPVGGTERFEIPSLPPPDGTELLDGMQARMRELTTYRVEETLDSGRAVVRVDYAFQAPDRMRIETHAGSARIQIGTTRYRRSAPDEPWQETTTALPAEVPLFIWDTGEQIAPRIVGGQRVEGVRTRILSFFGPTGSTPIWFGLWVDPEGLVRRAEMRAQGHFMDHRYLGFDKPVEIEAPEVAG